MNKLEKAIAKLPKEYKATFDYVVQKLLARNFLGLQVGKLKGYKHIYRLKHGRLRIIFFNNGKSLEVLKVDLRNENTYKNF